MDVTAVIRFGVDMAIAIMLIEAVILSILYARGRIGLPHRTIWLIAASGLMLILAIRVAIHSTVIDGASLHGVGVFLALGGIMHAVDLIGRIRAAKK